MFHIPVNLNFRRRSYTDQSCNFILQLQGILRSIVEKFKNSMDLSQIDVHFMSESGLIDFFVMLGPKPNDVFRQNSELTGVYPLPPVCIHNFIVISM